MIHPEITDNELKAIAHEHGYRLIKLNTREKLLPCPKCGKKRTRIWFSVGKETHDMPMFRCCNHCGFEGDYAKTKTESYKTWNEAVRRYLDDAEVSRHDKQ